MATMSLDDALTLGDRLAAQGQHAQAASVYAQIEQGLIAAPPSGARLRTRAEIHLRRGALDPAVDAFVQALRLDPESRDPAARLHRALEEAASPLAARLGDALEQARLDAYQADIERLRASPYLDWPHHVHLETLARCNAACSFCPYDDLDRKGARLEDAVIDKVITDLTDVPRDVPFQLSPFKVNEPFLDVRLFDVLDRIAERLPQARTTLTSNASALTEAKARRLAGRPTLTHLYVSFNDHREAVYEATMRLPFRRTLDRLDTLHRLVADGTVDLPITLSRVGDGTANDRAFRAWCADRWPAFGTLVLQRGDWIGQVTTDVPAVPDVGCVRWFDLSITATGVVAHCCMDGHAAHPLGDVREQHVLDIYNQPAFRRLRERALTRRGETPCGGCTFL